MTETSPENDISSVEKELTRKIVSYKDLLEEEERLTEEFNRHKARVAEDINIIKLKLQPAGQALNFMGRMASGPLQSGLVSKGANLAIDLLSKKYLFRGSGLLMTLAGSFLVKGAVKLWQKNKARKDNAHKAGSNGKAHSAADEMLNQ
ncbi:MAG TPA: hypothetical protein VK166_09855 [Chitinophagaceae bacterium]|nr:hypothetical protein [Chitinophagaceae bacterium]